MRTKHVFVEEYNPFWSDEFKKIKTELMSVLLGKVISIEHVGSTAVKGLAAKPIIDIDVVIDGNFDKVREALKTLGYYHEGDLGIKGREAFAYVNKEHLMLHHLYVCNFDNGELHRHLSFRNHLRQNEEDRIRYSNIKKIMAKKYPYDIDSYIKGKQSVIEEIYEKCGLEK